MRVDVLCFGVLKDRFGGERKSVELCDGARVRDLVRLLEERGPRDQAIWKALAVAVNREYAALETILKDGDEVAFLPPVSGGCFFVGESTKSMSPRRDIAHPELSWGGCLAR